ncbi:KTSC domain-containing protein [Bradyrhizobium sp. AUGA SZCCT0240]|nr:KTSC domain-containing protein [Bradyrhizobium sp. AUGA SZCCT0158]MBR1240923.1 KTSC domain-containing protein [Bradyrhizobium sp. AUGA SZCCT0274]MBR1258507.1 KTSC domain-containing protein [Bradyrhizobium sp. AUGA SZCCT0240]
MVRVAAAIFMHLLATPVVSETIDVAGRSSIDLNSFECRDITRSSIVQRVCYDRARRHLIVAVKGAYDQYCDLPAETYDALLGAPSMGGFFNRHIRPASDARFACPN